MHTVGGECTGAERIPPEAKAQVPRYSGAVSESNTRNADHGRFDCDSIPQRLNSQLVGSFIRIIDTLL